MGVVILGASTYPNYPVSRKLDNEAFKRSAELAKEVLSAHTIFRDVKVLDLFDEDLRPDDLVDRIEGHVEAYPDMRDVVLYYCGHGDLLPDREHTYYLVLKGTRPGREVTTGLGIKQFRTMIDAKGVLTRRRCTFILDCCFAGEAAGAWQSVGLDTLIGKQLRDVLPSRGFAFLTASDKDLRAWGKGGYKDATMFTGALAEVLSAEAGIKRLSLGDLSAEMGERIRKRYNDWKEAVIPQCYAPRQAEGDISQIPIFVAGASMPRLPTMKPSELSPIKQLVSIVQFPHPQDEPRLGISSTQPWNTGRHCRKFLRNLGYYVLPGGECSERTSLVFWGEWEPPSRIVKSWRDEKPLPSSLHEPYWRRDAPAERQNTDPWVFGDHFLYSNCKQFNPRRQSCTAKQYTSPREPSALQRLQPGSIILFGSVIGDDFVLDTVFVVKASEPFTLRCPPRDISDAFRFCTIESLAAADDDEGCAAGADDKFTLYRGVTYDDRDQYNGTYSFVPCRREDAKDFRFRRPAISLSGYINPRSKQAPSGATRTH